MKKHTVVHMNTDGHGWLWCIVAWAIALTGGVLGVLFEMGLI